MEVNNIEIITDISDPSIVSFCCCSTQPNNLELDCVVKVSKEEYVNDYKNFFEILIKQNSRSDITYSFTLKTAALAFLRNKN